MAAAAAAAFDEPNPCDLAEQSRCESAAKPFSTLINHLLQLSTLNKGHSTREDTVWLSVVKAYQQACLEALSNDSKLPML